MDIELGIQNVARTVTFSTEQSADKSALAVEENRETDGKCIHAPSFFVFLDTFSIRKKLSFG